MLKQRVLTAALLAPAAIAGIIYLPLPIFIIVMTLLVLLGFWEWRRFVNTDSSQHVFTIASLITFSSLFFILPINEQGLEFDVKSWSNLLIISGGFWWLFNAIMIKRYPKMIEWWKNNAFWQQIFGLFTLLPFLVSVLILRSFNYSQTPFLGAKLVLLVCVLVWLADTGAYFAGRAFGKHKMAPNVSPNKTVEGLIGGLIASVLAMIFFVKTFAIPFESFSVLIFIAVVTSFASVLGDLAESMFKRVAGVKDSGHILPGHGGILDRIDSLTAAFPVFTLLYFGLA